MTFNISQLRFSDAQGKSVGRYQWLAFVRIFIGLFWLFEVTIGHNWKIGNPEWFGAETGAAIVKYGQEAITAGTWGWFAWALENVIYPYPAFWSYFVTGLQVSAGLAFIFGFLVRPTALAMLGMDLFIFMLGNSRIPPFFTAAHLFMLFTNAGMYYGADAWLVEKLKETQSNFGRFSKWVISEAKLSGGALTAVTLATAFFAVYYLLQMPVLATAKMQMVSLELAVILGLVSYGLYASRQITDKIGLVVAMLRIFIGYKFLHEIWVRSVPGLNGLPGWGTAEQLAKPFQLVVENHSGLIGGIAEAAFLPAIGFWALLFAVVQTAVGAMLLFGWKTRLASRIGLVYVGLLILMGFTRYAPFIFGYLVVLLALNGGRVLGIDSATEQNTEPGLAISPMFGTLLMGLSALAIIGALIFGVTPDGYNTTIGGVTSAMIAMLAGAAGMTGLLQPMTPAALDPVYLHRLEQKAS